MWISVFSFFFFLVSSIDVNTPATIPDLPTDPGMASPGPAGATGDSFRSTPRRRRKKEKKRVRVRVEAGEHHVTVLDLVDRGSAPGPSISSPRSLQACFREGILPEELSFLPPHRLGLLTRVRSCVCTL